MASRRALFGVRKWSEGIPSRSTCASSSLRNFSSRAQRGIEKPLGGIRPFLQPISRPTASPISTLSFRQFSSTPTPRHGHIDPPKPGEERSITFIDKENQSHTFIVSDGTHLLDIAQANDLEMEGACGGSCACSTCHVIVADESFYDKMEEPSDDENDMLDLAFGLTETSRLGCQVHMSKELDGIVVKLPRMTRNMQAGDFK